MDWANQEIPASGGISAVRLGSGSSVLHWDLELVISESLVNLFITIALERTWYIIKEQEMDCDNFHTEDQWVLLFISFLEGTWQALAQKMETTNINQT